MIYLLHQEVSLYLSPLRRQKSSTPLAVFTIPALSTTWNRLAVQVRHLSQPYQPPTWTWIATFLPWASWEVSFVFQVEGGTVRLFLNCQPADSTSIGRHQVIYAYSWRAGGECSNSIFRKWNLTRPLLSTLDRCHCGIKLNVDEVFFCRDRSFLGHIDEQESEDIQTTFNELLRWKGGMGGRAVASSFLIYWTQRSIDLDDLLI